MPFFQRLPLVSILLFIAFAAQAQLSTQTSKLVAREVAIAAAAKMLSDSFLVRLSPSWNDLCAKLCRWKNPNTYQRRLLWPFPRWNPGGLPVIYIKNSGNPFGMKAGPTWTGQVFMMWHEGVMTPFRSYATPTEAVYDFARFLRSRKWFKDALACPTGDYECFIKGMSANVKRREPGYAADLLWPDKVRRVIQQYGLEVLSKK